MSKQYIDTIELTDEAKEIIAADFDKGLVTRDGCVYGRYSASCARCGGRGYGHWFQDNGVCYECRGTGGHHVRSRKLTKKNGTLTRETARTYLPAIDPAGHAARVEAERVAANIERKTAIRRGLVSGATSPEFLDALRTLGRNDQFASSVRHATIRYGVPTEAQSAAIIKAAARKAEFAAKREAEDAASVDAPTGRVNIEGRIVSVKGRDTDFGYVYKALVVCTDDDGGVFKVYMTATDKLIALGTTPENGNWSDKAASLRGRVIRCAVTLKPSDDDPSFAFGSRPAKFEIRVDAADLGDLVAD